jgi:hypothetical protein
MTEAHAIAHIWFETIHPFDDGNGRVGRAIADLELARLEGTGQRFYSMSGSNSTFCRLVRPAGRMRRSPLGRKRGPCAGDRLLRVRLTERALCLNECAPEKALYCASERLS